MDKMKIHSRIWIKKSGKNYLGNGRVELLKQIQKEGSISKAAKKMYMSYKAAWDNLKQMKNLSEEDLFLSNNGGSGGGGTILTEEGKKAIEVFECLESLKEQFWEGFQECKTFDEMLKRAKEYQEFLGKTIKK